MSQRGTLTATLSDWFYLIKLRRWGCGDDYSSPQW